MYNEDEFLQLSGIQHFAFCRRQWALAYIEMQWQENVRTVEGKILHENAHDASLKEKRGDLLIVRAMPIHSREMGVSGECDVVEFHKCKNGISLEGRDGSYTVVPVEYKRGHHKPDERDEVQLAAQAMCMEEMYGINIPYGALYYDEVKRREIISISESLRNTTIHCAQQMHEVFKSGELPKANKQRHCKNCSLINICMPEMNDCVKVSTYLNNNLYEDIT